MPGDRRDVTRDWYRLPQNRVVQHEGIWWPLFRFSQFIENPLHFTAAAIVVAWMAFYTVQKIKGDPRLDGGGGMYTTWVNPNPVYKSVEDYYCNQPLNMHRLIYQIGHQVLRQEVALAYIEQELGRDRLFRSVALVGPPGVGKTLTTDALRQIFPWKKNTFWYFWSGSKRPLTWRYDVLRQFIRQLSDCGMNLIIIDMLGPDDYTVANSFNEMLLSRYDARNGAVSQQTVLVVYIFDLVSENIGQQLNTLQRNLSPHTPIVSYRMFGMEDLRVCLENELMLERTRTPHSPPFYYALSDEAKAKVLEKAVTAVANYGCKSLERLIQEHSTTVFFD